ncbi:MAG: bile acid:sodium symporter family protein [Gammaproteobacteria bacterium]|nr:bile acid:sodium symporter family protein [Gammaproteobacteria bacterium]
MCQRFTHAFPVWVIGAGILAVIYPPALTWFKGPFITYGLGVIMLGMGLTLTADDFKRILIYPKWILLGVVLQYTVMPFTGLAMATIFDLPKMLAVGLILVASCPGGTASNVVSFIAGANVALSVSMTAVSTLLAIVMTPLLTDYLVGSRLDVDAWKLFIDTIKVVLVPIVLGVSLNTFFHNTTEKILPVAPPIAVIVIALIVGSIIGKGKSEILAAGPNLFLAIGLLHLVGFLLGYLVSKLLMKNEQVARTISIEVGMQNSGLGVVLARENFAQMATIPGAISALTHCIYGSIASFIWTRAKKRARL